MNRKRLYLLRFIGTGLMGLNAARHGIKFFSRLWVLKTGLNEKVKVDCRKMSFGFYKGYGNNFWTVMDIG